MKTEALKHTRRARRLACIHKGLFVLGLIGLGVTPNAIAQDMSDRGSDDPALPSSVLMAIIDAFGTCDGPCPADFNQDGFVDETDFAFAVENPKQIPFHLLVPGLTRPNSDLRTCQIEPGPNVVLLRAKAAQGGGMVGNGWDGPGAGAATIYWYIENTTGDTGAGQRTALINGMAAWTGIVQITFREICLPNRNVAVDWAYRTLDHSAFEGAEAGDPDCPFDGAGGVLAHAGFPPGVNSTCINPMAETFAGNVHFDDDDLYEQDNAGGFGPFSITLIAAHEVGHSIGLVHDSGGGGPHIMRPGFSSNDASQAPSASDTANLQGGYAAGSGSVVTLNNSGVWVDNGFFGTERGNNSTNPVNTFLEGVNGVPDFTSNVIVHIEAGTYQQAITITQSMFLQAENGTVIIE